MKEKAVQLALAAAASTSVLIVALVFLFLAKESAPFAIDPGLSALGDTRWIPVTENKERFGIIPMITGSALVTILATALALPLGVLGAIYISEIAKPFEREILKPVVELLASIPSVVLGFFGLVVIAPAIKWLFGLGSGMSALTGAVLLAFMAVPTIVSISEDAIRAVPSSLREAALALGATRFETVSRVTTPAALAGIAAAVMLGMGRVVGETMAVLMVTGNSPLITASPLDPVRTLTATIAAEMGEVPVGGTHYSALFCMGVVLMLATFALNLTALRALKADRGK